MNNTAKEEGIKEIIDAITADISAAGGKVETVQKMDKRPFARIADKRNTSGFYANFIFEIAPGAIAPLRTKLGMNNDVFRVLFSDAPTPVEATK